MKNVNECPRGYSLKRPFLNLGHSSTRLFINLYYSEMITVDLYQSSSYKGILEDEVISLLHP